MTEKVGMFAERVYMRHGSGFDLWVYRTHAEGLLGDGLMELLLLVSGWSGFVGVHQQALLHRSRFILQDYRNVKIDTLTFWLSTVHLERLLQCHCGAIIQWYQPEAEKISDGGITMYS